MGPDCEIYRLTKEIVSQMTPRKRKAYEYAEGQDEDHPIILDEEESTPRKKSKRKSENEEKRLRRHRAAPPQSFKVIYERASSQRFYVLGRTRSGNIYVVHIAQLPSCTCPHARSGAQCKHILFVMSRVLRARYDLVYQLALLTTELQEIFKNAPPIDDGGGGKADDKNRKALEGDCPICFSDFEDGEAVVYCRATCGQNIHKECFDTWAKTKTRQREKVTCPMCRTAWQEEDDGIAKRIKNKGKIGIDGYVNVADQIGVSRRRDYSTYHYGANYRERHRGYGDWW